MNLRRMSLLKSFAFCGIAVLTTVPLAHAQDFSLDPMSPEVPATWSPATGVSAPGAPSPTIFAPIDIGLLSAENVDGFSYGVDALLPAGSIASKFFFYSVDRATVGSAAVHTEVAGNGAAGDAFVVFANNIGTALAPPVLSVDSIARGLTPGPGPGQTDLDGCSSPGALAGAVTSVLGPGVYFTVDVATATAAGPRWGITADPADVFFVPNPLGGPAPPIVPAVYATAAALGLVAGDDIDALAVADRGTPGMLDAADIVYVSLTAASPTLATISASPGSIIQVFPVTPVEVFAPSKLDLLAADELNALTVVDPVPVPAVSEWGLMVLVLLVLTAGTVVLGRRRRRAAA